MRRRIINPPGWEEILEQFCWSDFEGCVCGHPKGHDGRHECPACDCVWTDEQETEWHQRLLNENP